MMPKKHSILVKQEDLSVNTASDLFRVLGENISFSFNMFITACVVAASVYAMYTLKFSMDDILIYRLFQVFIVSSIASAVFFFRWIYYLLVMRLIKQKKFKVLLMKRAAFCNNVKLTELKGCTYKILKVLLFKYAFELSK